MRERAGALHGLRVRADLLLLETTKEMVGGGGRG
jgi:hypothetical protein